MNCISGVTDILERLPVSVSITINCPVSLLYPTTTTTSSPSGFFLLQNGPKQLVKTKDKKNNMVAGLVIMSCHRMCYLCKYNNNEFIYKYIC